MKDQKRHILKAECYYEITGKNLYKDPWDFYIAELESEIQANVPKIIENLNNWQNN